ncbi:transcriptional regulator [Rhodobacterales bacterium]|nr:transcriptional regulator [Rhodobacterales bacterium]
MFVQGRHLIAAAALFLALFGQSSVRAAELVMLEQPGCVWCKRWNEEIGVAYSKTEEGRKAPLRRVDITGPWPQDLDGIGRERLTPTFILIDNGVEIDRLRGYPGEHFFWPLFTAMLDKLP